MKIGGNQYTPKVPLKVPASKNNEELFSNVHLPPHLINWNQRSPLHFRYLVIVAPSFFLLGNFAHSWVLQTLVWFELACTISHLFSRIVHSEHSVHSVHSENSVHSVHSEHSVHTVQCTPAWIEKVSSSKTDGNWDNWKSIWILKLIDITLVLFDFWNDWYLHHLV